MPLLKTGNVADLARRTRRYLYQTDSAPPQTTDDLTALPQSDGRTVWVIVFGPAAHPAPSPFRRLFGVGLMDLPRRATSGFVVDGVRPIEAQLASLLAEFPADRGYSLVVVPVPRGVEDIWIHAARTDADARVCAERASGVERKRTF